MVDTQATAPPPPPPLSELSERGPLALFLDFDGTLIDIAPSPEAIAVPEGLAPGLRRLSARLEDRLALVSGRSVANIGVHLVRPGIAIAGSHGLERVGPDGSAMGPAPGRIPDSVSRAFRSMASQFAGLEYEAKGHGAALHYRAAPELEGEAGTFAEEQASRNGLVVKRGKCVVEVAPAGADKARAVHAFMREGGFAGAMPIFVGDDLTDEDGFRAAIELGGFGVIVGDRPETLARYRLATPRGVREWLEL